MKRSRCPATASVRLRIAFVTLLVALTQGSDLVAQDALSKMRDPEDGAFDISGWLASAGGFLPIAQLITEPALGYGGAVALAFLHRPPDWDIDEERARFESRGRMTIPSVSVGFGMYTANDSWIAGGGHMGVWGGGAWRYTGGAAISHFNLSIAGELPDGEEALFDYSLEGWGFSQSLRYKLGGSDFFVGGLYSLMGTTTRFAGQEVPGAEPSGTESTLGAAGLSLAFDSRNNSFTTDRGIFATIEGRRQDEAFGGDYEYWSGTAQILAYFDPVQELIVGLRADGGVAGEGVPFWNKPAVRLRGVAAGRYAGDRTATVESELRWDFSRRWSVVGFGGAGHNINYAEVGEDQTRWIGSGGAGFRYLLARAFGMRGGMDFAYGEDGFAFYFTMGSAWGGR
jgi:hypothetical protein